MSVPDPDAWHVAPSDVWRIIERYSPEFDNPGTYFSFDTFKLSMEKNTAYVVAKGKEYLIGTRRGTGEETVKTKRFSIIQTVAIWADLITLIDLPQNVKRAVIDNYVATETGEDTLRIRMELNPRMSSAHIEHLTQAHQGVLGEEDVVISTTTSDNPNRIVNANVKAWLYVMPGEPDAAAVSRLRSKLYSLNEDSVNVHIQELYVSEDTNNG